MDGDGVSFRELLDYTDGETERWFAWLRARGPQVLETRMGEGARATVRDVIGHVVGVELRYAQRLRDLAVTEFEEMDTGSLDALWNLHREARTLLRAYLGALPPGERQRNLVFHTRSLGRLEATAHKVTVHLFLHGIRHWAQIATALRQAGHPSDWQHDFLLSDAVR